MSNVQVGRWAQSAALRVSQARLNYDLNSCPYRRGSGKPTKIKAVKRCGRGLDFLWEKQEGLEEREPENQPSMGGQNVPAWTPGTTAQLEEEGEESSSSSP